MSIANGTTYYDYPLVQLTDRPTFADYNGAFSDIDAKLHGLITGAETDHQAITDLQTGLGQTDTLLASVKLTADGAKAKSDTNEENITILNTHLGQTDRNVATKLDSVAIAEPYDPNAGTYSVGDIVVYNGQRYRCTTAVAVAEPFDADKWTGEDVQTIIDGIDTALSSIGVAYSSDAESKSLAHNSYTKFFDVPVSDKNRLLVVSTSFGSDASSVGGARRIVVTTSDDPSSAVNEAAAASITVPAGIGINVIQKVMYLPANAVVKAYAFQSSERTLTTIMRLLTINLS